MYFIPNSFEKVVDYTEQILKRENGFFKADKEKINFSLVDPYAYEDLGKCLTIGAKKYSPDNWKLGDIESYIAALDRHLIDIKKAVLDKDKTLFIDKDTTLQHGANLMCNAMFIHYFIRKENTWQTITKVLSMDIMHIWARCRSESTAQSALSYPRCRTNFHFI